MKSRMGTFWHWLTQFVILAVKRALLRSLSSSVKFILLHLMCIQWQTCLNGWFTSMLLHMICFLGFSSLVLDSSHTRLFASCMDSVIYEFDCAAFSSAPGNVISLLCLIHTDAYVLLCRSCHDQQCTVYILAWSVLGCNFLKNIVKLLSECSQVKAKCFSTEL